MTILAEICLGLLSVAVAATTSDNEKVTASVATCLVKEDCPEGYKWNTKLCVCAPK